MEILEIRALLLKCCQIAPSERRVVGWVPCRGIYPINISLPTGVLAI